MPEYVYALHDFQPENEDEVSFHPGERIEVIEKDEEFGDGWWKVSVFEFLRCSTVREASSRSPSSSIHYH